MPKKNGGPAFPVQDGMVHQCLGMSLRDWFAGQALAGITADIDTNRSVPTILAKWVYEIADAMIAESEK